MIVLGLVVLLGIIGLQFIQTQLVNQEIVSFIEKQQYTAAFQTYDKSQPLTKTFLKQGITKAFKDQFDDYITSGAKEEELIELVQDVAYNLDGLLLEKVFLQNDQKNLFDLLHQRGFYKLSNTIARSLQKRGMKVDPQYQAYASVHHPVEIKESGYVFDGQIVGYKKIDFVSQDRVWLMKPKATTFDQQTHFAMTPLESERLVISYYTENLYGFPSETQVYESDLIAFKDFDRIQDRYVFKDEALYYSLSSILPSVSSEPVAFYTHDGHLIIEKEDLAHKWHFYQGYEEKATIGWYLKEGQLVSFEDLDETTKAALEDRVITIKKHINQIKFMGLDQVKTSDFRNTRLEEALTLKTWSDFKTLLSSIKEGYLVPANAQEQQATDGLVYRIEDELYLSFGYQTQWVYRFGKDYGTVELMIFDDYTTGEITAASTLYSFAMDDSFGQFSKDILTLVGDLKIKQKKPLAAIQTTGTYLVNHITYGDVDNFDDHTVAKALYEGLGVCESYASFADLLLNLAGVESYYILADDEDPETEFAHAYNLIFDGKDYAYYDFTWADQVTKTNKKYYDFSLDQHSYQPVVSSYFDPMTDQKPKDGFMTVYQLINPKYSSKP